MSERLPALVLFAALVALPAGAGERFDPTRPAPAPGAAERSDAGSEPPRRLTSIRISPHSRVATIDGRSVQVGDRVGGASVLAIDLTTVRLLDGELEFELPLHRTDVRKRRAREE